MSGVRFIAVLIPLCIGVLPVWGWAQTVSPADIVLLNGKVHTVNAAMPKAQAVAVQGQKIVYAGDNATAKTYIGAATQVIDMRGRTLLPGFHDVHIHALESGSPVTDIVLDEQGSIDEHLAQIEGAIEAFEADGWFIGYGHGLHTLLESDTSPKMRLDEVTGDIPSIIMEQSSHSMWVNSAALQRMQWDEDSPDPVGGVLLRDPSERLTGILLENAGNMAMERAMASRVSSTENYLGLRDYTLEQLAKVGITSITDARAYWQRGHVQIWQQLAREDALTLRVALALWAHPELDDKQQMQRVASMYSADASSLLKVNQIKVYADGILHNTTAALKQPYTESLYATGPSRGLNYFTQHRLENWIRKLEPLGFDFLIHTIGDRGVHEALNAIERASKHEGRHRLTHVEMVDKADLPRFAALNVTADAQVAGEFTQPQWWQESAHIIGSKRADNQIPLASLHKAKSRITLSSDWSVSSFNPFIGLQNAVTRSPQALSLEQAIHAYTLEGAYTMRQEHQTGSIEVGKKADLILLDRDLFAQKPQHIARTRVSMTLFDGEVIYTEKLGYLPDERQ